LGKEFRSEVTVGEQSEVREEEKRRFSTLFP